MYLSELRTLANDCEFGDTLNVMLRDRLVCGLNDPAIQKRLLTEGNGLTLEKAVTIAQALESAVKDSQDLSGVHQAVHTVAPPRQRRRQATNGHDSNPKQTPCYRCGRAGHSPDSCRFKKETCHHCRKVGHIKKVCRSLLKEKKCPVKKITEQSVENEYSLMTVNSVSSKPIVVSVVIDKCLIDMELDTGAAVSLVSEQTFKQHWPNKTLEESTTTLQTYSGEDITVQGVVQVDVEYKNQNVTVPMFVVAGSGPSLFGRNWLKKITLDWHDIHRIHSCTIEQLVEKYNTLFEAGLGMLRNFQAKIFVDPNVRPKFFKPRPIPYAFREKVEDELSRLTTEGIIEPLQFSEWAAPIVPVLKGDGKSIRICGDYSVTVNKASKLECYPIPKIDDLLTSLTGGVVFSKLDMSQAYQQVVLDEASKQYVVINTHKGLFRYNRLPFGVSSAPAIFQRVMENLLQEIPNVAVYFDDILIAGKSTSEHLSTLEKVLSKLQEAGLRLRKDKCQFMVESISYLGYRIDKQGIHPTSEKVRAIKEAPQPQNTTELKSFLGLLSYYHRFMPHLPTVLFPLYRLLRHDVLWNWSKEAEEAFIKSKELLTCEDVLVHFDPTKELILACDASPYGIGAVLAHKMPDGTERPIAFTSRTLSSTEKKYAQIEKEGLACVFGVKKFHCYIYGRHFTLITDHKPLLSLFDGSRAVSPQSSARIQRWALTLASYEYDLKYKISNENANADAMSHLPLREMPTQTPAPKELILLMESIANSPVTSSQICLWTKTDPTLSLVSQFLTSGWPETCPSEELKPYWLKQNELSLLNGCILRASRVVIPKEGRRQLLCELHEGHFGISKAKSRARSCIWWPGIDGDIEKMVKSCNQCQQTRGSPPEAPIYPWPWPLHPWSRLHVDFAGPINNVMFLVIVDAHSKWIEVFPMPSATSSATIRCLQTLFAQFGLPKTIVSDNGSCFVSQEFEKFLKVNGIRHLTSAPYHPATNGLAERAVQIIKNGLKRDTEGTLSARLARILFNYRISPHSTTEISPAELLFGRKLNSKLDLVRPNLSDSVQHKQLKQKWGHDVHSHNRKFSVGDKVYYRNFSQRPNSFKWLSGIVTKHAGPASLLIQSHDGQSVRRHVDQVRKCLDENSTPVEHEQELDVSTAIPPQIDSPEILNPSITQGSEPSIPQESNDHTSQRSPYPRRNRRPPNRFAPVII
jgi:hypothetical protein